MSSTILKKKEKNSFTSSIISAVVLWLVFLLALTLVFSAFMDKIQKYELFYPLFIFVLQFIPSYASARYLSKRILIKRFLISLLNFLILFSIFSIFFFLSNNESKVEFFSSLVAYFFSSVSGVLYKKRNIMAKQRK